MAHCEEILSQIEDSADSLNFERVFCTIDVVNDKHKTYYLLYTKVHHYEETKFKDVYNILLLMKLRDQLLNDNDL